MLLLSDFKEVAEAIEKVSTFIKSSTAEEAVLKGILDRCESRQQDILHEIEFSMLSRKQRDILAKEIKNVRIERRNAKMLLELIEPFSHLVKSKSSSATFMASLGTKVKNILAEQESRVYSPKSDIENLAINANQHFEITPTDNAHKFKLTKKEN